MTVAELTERLRCLPDDMLVFIEVELGDTALLTDIDDSTEVLVGEEKRRVAVLY